MIRGLNFRAPVYVIQPWWPSSQLSRRMLQGKANLAVGKSISHVSSHEVQALHPVKHFVPQVPRTNHVHSGSERRAPLASQPPSLQTVSCISSQREGISNKIYRGQSTMSSAPSHPTVPAIHASSIRHRRFASSPKMDSAVQYGRIQHVGILVSDTVASKTFYTEVLGMLEDSELGQMKLPFSCASLKAGNSQIHLMEHPSPDMEGNRQQLGARDRHVALTVKDLGPLIASLEKHGKEYSLGRGGRRAVFSTDLDMNILEFIEDPSL